METVVVTGIKASLATAEDIKKSAPEFVDSIVAEDIVKLPDNQVVDALQHVTGIQVQHGNGQGENDQIVIRGLPDIASMLNGREIFATTGRYVALADIPAELLERVDVHKSTEADNIEGGLAGLVDIRLHRPFDFDGEEIAGSLQGGYSTVSKHIDPTASILLSNRRNSSIGEIGALLDVSYKKTHYIDQDGFDYYEGQLGCLNDPATGQCTPDTSGINPTTGLVDPTIKGIHEPETIGGITYFGARERASVNLSTQWRPNGNTEVFAEVFYTRYRNPNGEDFLIGLPWNSGNASALTYITDPIGAKILKTATICCFNLTSNQSFHDSTNTYQAAAGVNWSGENLTLSSEMDYTDSRYKRMGVIVDTAIFDTMSFDTDYQGGGMPNITTPPRPATGS